MKVNKSFETETGGVTFDGELNKEELDLIISIGLNHLLMVGALPMKVLKQEDHASVGPGTETNQ